jgi:hypothetical protein
MEMPDSCGVCRFAGRGGYHMERIVCMFTGKNEYAKNVDRLSDCPLIALPDHHGRLVDADALEPDADYDDGETAVVFMGHGTHHEANAVYGKMQEKLTADGFENPACDENFHHGDTDKYLYFERCYADIANAVETNASSRVDLVHGMLTQKILLAIYSSAQNGKRVLFSEKINEPVFKFS